MLRSPALIACVISCALAPAALAAPAPAQRTRLPDALTSPLVGGLGTATPAGASSSASSSSTTTARSTSSDAPIPVPASNTPPAGRRLSANRVLAIAGALPKMRAVRRKYPRSIAGAYLKLPFHWQVSFFSHDGKKEIGQVIIDDLSGRVLEQWTGFQVAWTMARGYPGAFGRHVNALYIWLPLCVLFLFPFFDFRRPFSLLHLDLLVLLSFSISLAFFNHARIYASVPLAYPPLLYLLARMLALSRPHRRGARPLRLLVPAPWLALAVVFLIAFRIALNVTDSNVIDVGYAGVVGAQRILHDRPLYGSYPSDNEHGDTYGPVNYLVYVPFVQIFGWSGKWDDLPAAHAAAIAFDLLAVALIFLLGRRVRGPSLGIVLSYAWVSYPFTLFALESNSNDTLVAVLVLAALLLVSSAPARGAFAALAGLTKFAPLTLTPLLGTYDLWRVPAAGSESAPAEGLPRTQALASRSPARRARVRAGPIASFLIAFVLAATIVCVPALSHDSLHTIYERTIAYQANRNSPFSVWGLYGGLGGFERGVEIGAVVLALSLALVPARRDLIGLAGACAAVIIATQLAIEHWFYLYIPWFFAPAMLALLGGFSSFSRSPPGAASAPARSNRRALALSSG